MQYHIGVIPDGNRRWAREQGLPEQDGHARGAECMEEFIFWSTGHPDIREVSIYALSEENFKRSGDELAWLYDIYVQKLNKLLHAEDLHRNQVNVRLVSTSPRRVPGALQKVCNQLRDATSGYSQRVLNFLIGYTGQNEVLQSVGSLRNRIKNLFVGLSAADLERDLGVRSDCDFIIRTGEEEARREARSGFLLWQSAYSEYLALGKFWPEVDRADFDEAWEHFLQQRRLKGR